jgi:protein-disulfide isomerase
MSLAGCGGGSGDTAGGNAATPVAGTPAPAGKNWAETVVKTPEGGYLMGNADAPIKLVEYGSRTCPTCGAFGREGMPKLVEQYVSTGKVSFEYRDFMVHGAPDLAAGLLGGCAGAEPFFPILEQMFQNQEAYLQKQMAATPAFQASLQGKAPGQIATAWAEQLGLIDFVKQRGVPEAQARACLADTAAIDALVKITDEGAASGKVTGTPSFLINGERAEATGWSQLEPLLKAAGA